MCESKQAIMIRWVQQHKLKRREEEDEGIIIVSHTCQVC